MCAGLDSLTMSTDAQERIPAFTIGDRLRRARQKVGLEQADFAQEIGVSRGTVSNYEHAEDIASLKKPYLLAWAMRTDVPLEWLLTGEAPTAPPDPPTGRRGRQLEALTAEKASRTRRRGGTPDTAVFQDVA